jgi:hypothetical protein
MEKNMKKLYLTKVNPFAQAKWQNKKKKKTNASPISGRQFSVTYSIVAGSALFSLLHGQFVAKSIHFKTTFIKKPVKCRFMRKT